MDALHIVLALVAVAIAAWLINSYAPIAGKVRTMLNVVLTLIVVGTLLWLVNTYVPMAGSIQAILNIVVVVGTCVWVLKVFGIWGEVVGLWHSFTSHQMPPDERTPHS